MTIRYKKDANIIYNDLFIILLKKTNFYLTINSNKKEANLNFIYKMRLTNHKELYLFLKKLIEP